MKTSEVEDFRIAVKEEMGDEISIVEIPVNRYIVIGEYLGIDPEILKEVANDSGGLINLLGQTEVEGLTKQQNTKLQEFLKAARLAIVPQRIKMNSSLRAVINSVFPAIAHMEEEATAIVPVRNQNILPYRVIAIGKMNSTTFYGKDLLRVAIRTGANAFYMVHNHPGSSSVPSEQDLEATRQISRTARGLGLILIDSLVIGPTDWTSMAVLTKDRETYEIPDDVLNLDNPVFNLPTEDTENEILYILQRHKGENDEPEPSVYDQGEIG